jgi:hypothetical protein
LAQAQNEALLEDWTALGGIGPHVTSINQLKAAVAAKYKDPNRAFKAFNEFMDLKMTHSLDVYENKFGSLLDEMEDGVSTELQVKHYLRGLRHDIQVRVLSHFATSQTTYELQAAKQQARVFFESVSAPGPAQTPAAHRAAATSAAATQRVRFQVNPSVANNQDRGSGPQLKDYAPFLADQQLHDSRSQLVTSKMYPGYYPTTLAGKLGSPDANGTPGHKLRMFLGANNMCNLCHVRSFLGLANFYRAFVRKFGHIAAPLTELTKKDNPFTWSKPQEDAFNSLKKALVNAPVLAIHDPTLDNHIYTDASEYAYGAVLMQKQNEKMCPIGFDDNDKLHPISFLSHRLSAAEKNYDTFGKGFSAMRYAARKWHVVADVEELYGDVFGVLLHFC